MKHKESYEDFIDRMSGASPPLFTSAGQVAQRSGESLAAAYMRTHREACGCEHCRAALDWPMPRAAPTTPPDDEALERPDD